MKKKLLWAFLVIVATGAIFTLSNRESDTELLRKKHADFLRNHPYNKSLALSKKERKAKAMPPNSYFEQEYLLEMNPNTGKPEPQNYIEVQAALVKSRPNQKVPGDTGNSWVERGPNNVGGRTRVVLFDPNDATHKRAFAGGISGGLWVTNDITAANATWTRVGIDENLSVSCMTVDPNNSQIMYLGTGEAQTGDDAVGNGVWKSTDGGNSWTQVYTITNPEDRLKSLYYINDIIAWNNPSSGSTEIFFGAAGEYHAEGKAWLGYKATGLYKSTDGGANFTKIALNTPENTAYEPNDFEIGADNTLWIGTEANAYGHGGGTIFKSNNGSTFSKAFDLKTSIANSRRTEIAVSKTNPNKIYALVTTPGHTKKVQAFYTTNGFTSVNQMSQPADADTDISNNDFTRGQYWYDLVLEVDPVDDNKVYVGGIDLFRSTDAGANWKQISKWSNNNNLAALNVPTVHADQHSWAFHPTNPNIALIGNDGGVYYASSLSGAENTTTAIEARNTGYNITQFYHGEIGQSTANELLLAGAQDNGTQLLNGATAGINSSTRVYGGDGAYSFIDKDGDYMIVSYVYNVKARLNLPYTGAGITLDNTQDTGNFINAQELDDNLDILYANGSKTNSDGDKVYDSIIRYTGIKSGQTLVKKMIGNALLDGNSSALKVSPFTTTSTTLFVGTDNGKLLRIKNANTANPNWANITGSLPAGSISDIAFGANEDEILVTFHNYGVVNIWFTTDGGSTWENKEGNFPDIPVKAILMNPLNNDEVIIGTQLGVWRTGNFKAASPSWSHAYNGMSNVKVTSFDLRAADNTVLATTYGRGMFTGQFSAPAASVEDVLADTKVFTLYPTVSNGNFTLFAKNTLGKATMNIFDMTGKQVYTKKLNFNQNNRQTISVQLSSGVYIVNLLDENNKKSTEKLIIK